LTAPGRTCPLSYRYAPESLRRAPELAVESLWIAGGLYGNPFALESLLALYERERGTKALVFNGDFHWFDARTDVFDQINRKVLGFAALRGNIEAELATPVADAGCGCAYPDWVDDGTVERSNEIIERLRPAAGEARALAALPMHLVARVGAGHDVGDVRVGPQRRVVRDHELRRILQVQQHAVAARYAAALLQPAGERVRLALELGIRQPLPVVVDRRALGMARNASLQIAVNGFARQLERLRLAGRPVREVPGEHQSW